MRASPLVLGSLALAALAGVTFASTSPTNFRGFDEWVNVSLLSSGILEFPYANRPLNMVWGLPPWLLWPDRFSGFLVFHVAYIGLSGVLVFLITHRLAPGAKTLAFLAGAFTVVWAPGDRSRVCAVQMILYSGCTFGALLAVWLTLEAWHRRRPAIAAVAATAGAAAVLSFEATLATLSLVPLLLLAAGGRRDLRRLGAWTLATLVLLAAFGLRFALPRFTDPARLAYQGQIAADVTPGPLADRAWRQLRRHVAPVAERPPTASGLPTALFALAVFAVGFVACARRPRGEPDAGRDGTPSWTVLVATAGLGLLWALAAYLPFVLNPEDHGAERKQFLSAPGVAALLAAVVVGMATAVPRRGRRPAVFLLGAWIVGGGVLRTAALQQWWHSRSAYPSQRQALVELAAVVPDLAPGTLLVVLDSGAWPLDMTFRHAIRYFYEGRATGHAPGALDYMYETRFEAAGVRSVPDPVLHDAWRDRPALFTWDKVVVVREDARGHVQLLETWPPELPPLPPGATYAPRTRIRHGPRLPRLLILGR